MASDIQGLGVAGRIDMCTNDHKEQTNKQGKYHVNSTEGKWSSVSLQERGIPMVWKLKETFMEAVALEPWGEEGFDSGDSGAHAAGGGNCTLKGDRQ